MRLADLIQRKSFWQLIWWICILPNIAWQIWFPISRGKEIEWLGVIPWFIMFVIVFIIWFRNRKSDKDLWD